MQKKLGHSWRLIVMRKSKVAVGYFNRPSQTGHSWALRKANEEKAVANETNHTIYQKSGG